MALGCKMASNKRLANRVFIKRKGWVSFDPEASPIDCLISDISDTGAKILLGMAKEIPSGVRIAHDGQRQRTAPLQPGLAGRRVDGAQIHGPRPAAAAVSSEPAETYYPDVGPS